MSKTDVQSQEDLAQKWIDAKFEEDKARMLRLAIENKILDSGINLKDEGTNHYRDDLIITTGYTRKWDQGGLSGIDIPEGLFSIQYKENRKFTKVFEEMYPDEWRKTFVPLLELTPKKPGFKEKKS